MLIFLAFAIRYPSPDENVLKGPPRWLCTHLPRGGLHERSQGYLHARRDSSNQVKREGLSQIFHKRLVSVKVCMWKRTRYFLGTASVWIKGLEKRVLRKCVCVGGGSLMARRVPIWGGRRDPLKERGGQTWPDQYFRMISPSGRNRQEASLEQGTRRRQAVKSKLEQV